MDNVGVINETCKLAGIDRITPDTIDLEDWEVWKDIREDNTAIFQWQSDFGNQILKKLFSDETIAKIKEEVNISYLDLFSFGNALIRPCGASVREDAINGIVKKTGVREIDELLADELGNNIIQESFMSFTMKFCGYSLNMADKLRKGIAKKKGTEQFLEEVHNGFIENSKDRFNLTDEKCESIIQPVLQCISDASRYAFSRNHSESYSYIGYACGWLRHYYPLEFIATCLNIWGDKVEKISSIMEYVKRKKIIINQPKFRHSKSTYFMDKENNAIYKGIASIKFMNEVVPEELYSLRDNKYNGFIDLLYDISNKTSLNSKQLEILTRLDYFSEFGNSKSLLRLIYFFEKFKKGEAKQMAKDKVDGVMANIIIRHSRESAKTYLDLETKEILRELEEFVRASNISDLPVKEKIITQQEYLGYIDFRTGTPEDRTKLLLLDVRALVSKKTEKIWAYCFNTMSIGTGKVSEILVYNNVYQKDPVKKHDIIKVNPESLTKKEYNGRTSWYLSNYKQIFE